MIDTQTINLFPGPAYIGKVGERLELELRLIARYDNPDAYKRYLYRFIDPRGNYFIWRTHKDAPVEKDREYMVRATIKTHSRKRVETVLSNCRFR